MSEKDTGRSVLSLGKKKMDVPAAEGAHQSGSQAVPPEGVLVRKRRVNQLHVVVNGKIGQQPSVGDTATTPPPVVSKKAGKLVSTGQAAPVESKKRGKQPPVVNGKGGQSRAATPLPAGSKRKRSKRPKRPKRQAAVNEPAYLTVQEIRVLCEQRWPGLFGADAASTPLKVGIREDMVAALKAEGLRVSRKGVGHFLKAHCRQPTYLQAMNISESRWDLAGGQSVLCDTARLHSAKKLAALADKG